MDSHLADRFVVKIPVADDHEMTDALLPDNNAESVDKKEDTLVSIEQAPGLPKNLDEETSSPPLCNDLSVALKGQCGHTKKKDMFQDNHRNG